MNVEVDTLIGKDATYMSVRNALQRGRHHLFHYAGHGQFNADLPEMSGLILHDEQGSYTLTASDLSILVQDTDLRLVFLSCCLSAQTASVAQAEHGDVYGTLEALARADVPIVLGYRWTVPDASAQVLAHVFYQTLWHTFSPADALFQARRDTAMGARGRNDDAWASPILLMQNI
jgi:CHAT domain-containing protein